MADKDTGLEVYINARANKDSAKEAVNDLTKSVLSSLGKDGCIEIPADIKVPIKGASKELQKAQEDVIKQWEKTFSEGFSSSAEDLNDLTQAYQRFKRLAGQEHKARSKQYREINGIMGEQIQQYNTLRKAKRAEMKENLSKAIAKNNKKKSALPSNAEINADIKKEQIRQTKKYNGLKSTGPKGYPSSGIDAGRTNSRDIQASEFSSYSSNWAQAIAKSMKEEYEKSAASLKVFVDKTLAESAPKGRATTKDQFLQDVLKAAKTELTELVKNSEAGDKDATPEAMYKQADFIKAVTLELNKDWEAAYTNIKGAMEDAVYGHATSKVIGGTNKEEGKDRGVGPNHENTNKAIKQVFKQLQDEWSKKSPLETMARRFATDMATVNKTVKTTIKTQKELNSAYEQYRKTFFTDNKTTKNENGTADQVSKKIEQLEGAVKSDNTKSYIQQVRESSREGLSDTKQGQNMQKSLAVTTEDAGTGFNTNDRAEELIQITQAILDTVANILSAIQRGPSPEQLALPAPKEIGVTSKGGTPKELYQSLKNATNLTEDQRMRILADASNAGKKARKKQPLLTLPEGTGDEPPHSGGDERKEPEEPYQNRVEKSRIYASPFRQNIFKTLEDTFDGLLGITNKTKQIINATADEQDEFAAKRVKEHGLNNGRNTTDTGDIARMKRMLQLYRSNKGSIDKNSELNQKIKLTGGREVDTTRVLEKLNKVLSGKQMRNAQMGGSPLRQLLGYATGFIGMPSLEKSRAQADGLNEIFGETNKALNDILTNIQIKETELSGMEKTGQAKFDKEGYLTSDSSSAAFKTLADLEEEKLVLDTILADMASTDEIVKSTGGKFSKLVKQLSFTSPVLSKNNAILRNMNAGLDKNGKALKFQTRTAEILNYTFQLMSRSIGQMIKNWALQLNPITQIKKAFSDFMSYDVKWKRTMNVIKYNLQTILRPFMEWIAQKIVNLIGFVDIISMKIQKAFGRTPISLFDQSAADAEKMRRELEEAANVTAGFDELHDIGSNNSGENDLLGEIYKPQLSPEWEALANKIGDLFAGIITGDMGFREVMKNILQILGESLGLIAKTIWNWFKNTAIGKYLTEHWKGILATILAIFLGWKLLKIAGKLLANALFGKLGEGAIGKVFANLGTKFMDVFTSTQFGSDFVRGIKSMFTSGGMIGTFKMGGESLGAIFAQSLVAVVGVAIAGVSLGLSANKMKKNTSYNAGIDSVGGDNKDKKSNFGAAALGTLGAVGGGALTGLAIGGPIGAAIGAGIGAIAGLLNATLAPALENAAIKARDMNNEMQKIEYYEGQVQGAQSQVSIFDEQLNLLKQSLDLSTQSVYDQGEKLGISKTRMDELIKATQDGTYNNGLLKDGEYELADSLTNLAEKQEHTTEVSKKLEEAQKKLLKAQTDLSIAQDVEAGNFELAAARIEVAEAQGVYSAEEATKKRIQIYKEGGDEERKNLLQNLTPQQRTLMAQYTDATDKELTELAKIWRDSSKDVQDALLDGVGDETQSKFKKEMDAIDTEIKSHQGFWQGVGDTLKEIFSLGKWDTWTYNGETKYYDTKKKGKLKVASMAVGTNYVPSDGLAYIHQGEAVIPKKYNQPYQSPGLSTEEREYMSQMMKTMQSLDSTIAQGIPVKGEFRQRGSDLVATVERNQSRQSNNVLNNRVYAR